MSRLMILKPLILGTALCASISATAQTKLQTVAPAGSTISYPSPDFSKFTPRPVDTLRLDYGIWNYMLESMVVYTGPSTRMRSRRPKNTTGSRMIRGHTSPYRMEGNKIAFSRFDKRNKELITEYRQDLERIANEIDIAALPKKEQLAFWLNIHNIVVIEKITHHYPLKKPQDLIVSQNATLHNAKLLTIHGTALSLRDIRENIVYANWKDPVVAYGFFHGDIGSPSIQFSAYTADNVDILLARNAEEFVDSLRGFQLRGGKANASKLYWDLQPFYFRSFDNDLTQHLKKYMGEEAKQELNGTTGFQMTRYESTIADLVAGRGNRRSSSQVQINGSTFNDSSVVRFVRELQDKKEILIKQGRITTGTVTIRDIMTEDTADEDVILEGSGVK